MRNGLAVGGPDGVRDMARKSTIHGHVERVVCELAGAAICDDCITDRLNLSERSQANAITRVMGELPGFSRGKGECSVCGRRKAVIGATLPCAP